MDGLFEFGMLCFTSLITVVNPIGAIPMYSAITSGMSVQASHNTAWRASLWAGIFMIAFAFAGKFVFDFFGISVNSLKIVGGILFFGMGYDMLQGRSTRFKYDAETPAEEHHPEYANDAAITPLAMPGICGPGTITISIVSMQEAVSFEKKVVLIGVMLLISILTWLTLRTSRQLLTFIGDSGAKVFMRILGLIIMMIAVEYVLAGLTAIVRFLISMPLS